MAVLLQPLRLLCLVAVVLAEPAPGRIPKVYNALITSNQNLEPSKAYPVYQPVLHDFAFPFHPAVYYGDFPVNNIIPQSPAAPPKNPEAAQPPSPPAPTLGPQEPAEAKPSQEPKLSNPPPPNDGPTVSPPLPPKTESPIPLNEFGLPPQVLPLGRFNPAYNGFTQVGPFTYTYPSFRFYDPYDPFGLSPYANLPTLYRPVANVLEPSVPSIPGKVVSPPSANSAASGEAAAQTPPPAEPNDLNVLNYASKDPAIPNVPPPPLPHGGLKSDNPK